MAYNNASNWTDLFELKCLLIFKKCETEKFPRGMASDLCKELEKSKNASINELESVISELEKQ